MAEAMVEAEAGAKDATHALCVNKKRSQGSIEAGEQVGGGKELLWKAMSMAHKTGMTVDEKTLGMIFDEFDVDTVCVPRCLALAP
eukprot:SAG11_NODE_22856_length_399_cov_0.526667_2_plen_84_part_01